MENSARPPKIIRFGPFEADLVAEMLTRNGLKVRLQDQPLKLLLLLLEQPGQIVTRELLRARLWPDDSFGDFDNGLNVAVRKVRAALGDDTDRPRYIETIPRRGYRFVAEVEDVTPPPAAQSTAAGPAEVSQPPVGVPVSSGPLNHRKLLLAAALLLLTVVAGSFLIFQRHSQQSDRSARPGAGPSGESVRRAVAVLGFRNSSGRQEDAWLSTALSEMFSTELAAGDHLRLISGEDVANIRLTQPKLDVDSVSTGTAGLLRKTLGADLIVSGSYAALDAGDSRQVRLDVRLQDAISGEILTEVSDNGTEKALFQLVGNVGARLRQKLGVSGVSDEEHSQVLASMPSNRQAGELYSNGLAKLRAYDAMAAKTFLEQSIAADPSFPLAHTALSDAWMRLGYDQRAIQEAQKAFDLSSSLLPTDRLQVQARSLEVKGEWDKAAEAYRTLYRAFPDDVEFKVSLARSLTRAGKGKDAIALLESPGHHGPGGTAEPGQTNAQVQLAIADAAQAVGDMERTAQASEASAATARAQGQTLLVAAALRIDGLALENLKQFERALAGTEEARHIYENTGDRFGLASILEVQANVLSDRGDLPGALSKYQQELAIAGEVGNRRAQASALNNIALVLNQQGDLAKSRTMWEQAESAFRDLGDKSNTAVVLVNIGGVLKDQGNQADARKNYEQALALSREINDASGKILALRALGTVLDAEGDFAGARKLLEQSAEIDRANGQSGESSENLADLADVLQHQGDLAGAKKTYAQAVTASQASGEKSLTAYGVFGLGRIAYFSGDLAEAKRNFAQALQLRKELGETFTVAESEMALAEVDLEEGRAADPEPQLRAVREDFRKAGKQDDLVIATTLLARALLAKGKGADAQRELGTLPPVSQIQSIEMRLAVLIATGGVERAAGKLPEARSAFQTALKEAGLKGYRLYTFEGRLGILECEPASDQRTSALNALSGDLRKSGFNVLLARAHQGGIL